MTTNYLYQPPAGDDWYPDYEQMHRLQVEALAFNFPLTSDGDIDFAKTTGCDRCNRRYVYVAGTDVFHKDWKDASIGICPQCYLALDDEREAKRRARLYEINHPVLTCPDCKHTGEVRTVIDNVTDDMWWYCASCDEEVY